MSLLSACGLLLALLLAQALAWGVARGLSLRLPWRIQALGIVLPLALLLPLLAGDRVVVPADAPILANIPDAPRVADPDWAHGVYNDAVLQLLPWEAEVRRAFAAGRLPLWSDLLDGGSSPWVNPQAAVLSPVAMLGRLLPLEHFLLGTIAVKLLLAFEGCWLLARLLGAGRRGAALGAGGFALGGPVLAWAVFPLGAVVAWSPWLVLAAVRVVRRPTARHAAVAGAVLGALLLAGHPEIAAAECLVAAGAAAAVWRRRAGAVWHRRAGAVSRRLAAAATAVALGTGLAAWQLLPFALVVPRSLRAVHAAEDSAPPPAAAADRRAFPPGEERLLLSPLSPWAFGRPFHEPFHGPGNWPIAAGGYLGLAALAGLAAALARIVHPPPGRGLRGLAAGRRRLALALLALGLAVALLAARFYPWRLLLAVLPLGGAAAVDRLLPAAALPLALLAALGLRDLLASRPPASRAIVSPAPASLAMALLAPAASLAVRHDPPLAALWLVLALGFLLAPRLPRTGIALVALASLLDLGTWASDALPRGHRQLFYPRTPLLASMASAAAPPSAWRAVAGGFSLYPSLLPMYGVADVRPDNPLALAQQLQPLGEVFDFRPEGRRYKSAFRHLDHPLLDFLNVRAVALPAALPAPPRFAPLDPAPPAPPSSSPPNTPPALRVYRNRGALPRFFLPVAAEAMDRGDLLAGLRALRDARRVLLDRGEVGTWLPPRRSWDPEAVRVLGARPGEVRLLLPEVGDKLLATSLPFPDGWTATSRGRALRRVVVNAAYLGVLVPAGTGRVDLQFAPPGNAAGAVLSALAAAAALLLAALPRSPLSAPPRHPASLPPPAPRPPRNHRPAPVSPAAPAPRRSAGSSVGATTDGDRTRPTAG